MLITRFKGLIHEKGYSTQCNITHTYSMKHCFWFVTINLLIFFTRGLSFSSLTVYVVHLYTCTFSCNFFNCESLKVLYVVNSPHRGLDSDLCVYLLLPLFSKTVLNKPLWLSFFRRMLRPCQHPTVLAIPITGVTNLVDEKKKKKNHPFASELPKLATFAISVHFQSGFMRDARTS